LCPWNPACEQLSNAAAAERGHEPVKALELKSLYDAPSIINVRLAGYAHCSADLLDSSQASTSKT
jgi:hypothetical protein